MKIYRLPESYTIVWTIPNLRGLWKMLRIVRKPLETPTFKYVDLTDMQHEYLFRVEQEKSIEWALSVHHGVETMRLLYDLGLIMCKGDKYDLTLRGRIKIDNYLDKKYGLEQKELAPPVQLS